MIKITLNFILESLNLEVNIQFNYLNHIPLFIFLHSKACKEPPVLSTFVMLSCILENVKGEECRKNSARVWGVDKYKGKGVFKVNEEDKYKVEG